MFAFYSSTETYNLATKQEGSISAGGSLPASVSAILLDAFAPAFARIIVARLLSLIACQSEIAQLANALRNVRFRIQIIWVRPFGISNGNEPWLIESISLAFQIRSGSKGIHNEP